jgi:hypothetical protein
MELFKKIRLKQTFAVLACLLILTVGIADLLSKPSNVAAQSSALTVAQPNYSYALMVFTLTAQTKTQTLGGCASGTLEILGPATAATLQLFGSNDGGTNYFGLPFSTGAYASNVLAVTTPGTFPAYTGTPVMYFINLAGLTNFKVVSSGTFTGASASVKVVCSSNRGIF